MGEGSTRLPKPSTRQPKVEGSSMEEESTLPPSMEPTTEEAEQVRQGVWGDTTTTVLPEAYELLEEDPDAVVDKAKASDEVSIIKNSPEFCNLRTQKLDLEAKSPITARRGMEVQMVGSITMIAVTTQ